MGFIKAKSKISLITSTIFAVLLILCVTGVFKPFDLAGHLVTPLYIADALVGLLLLVFAMRFAKGKKFMPSGLMFGLSAAVLAVLIFVH